MAMRLARAAAIAAVALTLVGAAKIGDDEVLYIHVPAEVTHFVVTNPHSSSWVVEVDTDEGRFSRCDLSRYDGPEDIFGDQFELPGRATVPCVTWESGQEEPDPVPVFVAGWRADAEAPASSQA